MFLSALTLDEECHLTKVQGYAPSLASQASPLASNQDKSDGAKTKDKTERQAVLLALWETLDLDGSEFLLHVNLRLGAHFHGSQPATS